MGVLEKGNDQTVLDSNPPGRKLTEHPRFIAYFFLWQFRDIITDIISVDRPKY